MLFVMLYKAVLHWSLCMKSLSVTIKMKATEHLSTLMRTSDLAPREVAL